jgi:hypothetical protein
MINQKLDDKLISSVTGLSLEEIAKLKSKEARKYPFLASVILLLVKLQQETDVILAQVRH